MALNGPYATKSRGVIDTSASDQVEDDVEPGVNAGDFAFFIPWALNRLGTEIFVDISRAQQVEPTVEKKGKKAVKESTILEKLSASQTSFIPEPVDERKSVVRIATTYLGENLVHFKIHKTSRIPRHLIFIIGLAIRFYPQLYGIDLHSGVDKYTIHELCKFLPKSNITELSFDNNFLREANYELVLDSCKELKVLSLSRCRLGDEVVKRIAAKLEEPHPAASTLNVLNLSSNGLTDGSAKALAKMLRTNRHLNYLNISDNMITDIGGLAILTVFCSYRLTLEEVVMMKTKRLNYLKNKQSLIDSYNMESAVDRRRKSVWAKKPPVVKGKDERTTIEMANIRSGVFSDALRTDTFAVDGILHSNGNNTLAYLNMAYNNLSYLSLRLLLDVLHHQKDLERIPQGLINVCIEGNNLPTQCHELVAIDNLLEIALSALDKGAGKKKAGKIQIGK